jgi:hypothetical protein
MIGIGEQCLWCLWLEALVCGGCGEMFEGALA